MHRESSPKLKSIPRDESFVVRIIRVFVTSRLAPLLVVTSLIAGAVALYLTPKEEDPQMEQPVMQAIFEVPGASAEEVATSVATPIEIQVMNLRQIEDVYSSSHEGLAVINAKFEVGVRTEEAQVRFYNQLMTHLDKLPRHVKNWSVRSVDVDDVPIVTFRLFSDTKSDYELRRLAEEIIPRLQRVKHASRGWVVGGQPRQLQVRVDAQKAAQYGLGIAEIAERVAATNRARQLGELTQSNRSALVSTRFDLDQVDEGRAIIVSAWEGRPVYLRDVATVVDGPAERDSITRVSFGPAFDNQELRQKTGLSNVEIAVAKERGSNAVWVAEDLIESMEGLAGEMLPADVQWRVARNYGERADHKIRELTVHMGVSVAIVLVLMLLALSWREALIITLTVPQILGVTLLIVLLGGYTINGVTLFALIIAIGLLVDDPIVDVENVSRHLGLGRHKTMVDAVVSASDEIRAPTILATLCVIGSFVPLFFVTGLIGPYLRPLPYTVSWAMVVSLVVSLTTTPWLCWWILRPLLGNMPVKEEGTGRMARVCEVVFAPLVRHRWRGFLFLAMLVGALIWSWWLALTGRVQVKLLPYINNHDVQVYVEMPDGTSLEATAAVAGAVERMLVTVAEVTSVETYVGLPSPIDHNTMAKEDEMRRGANKADLRVYLMRREARRRTSREITLSLRPKLREIEEKYGAKLKIIEAPAGPPMMATIVGELYGPEGASQADRVAVARGAEAVLRKQPYLCDVDSSFTDEETRWRFVFDPDKPMLSGITNAEIESTLGTALSGVEAGVVHDATERRPLGIQVRLSRPDRTDVESLLQLYVKGVTGTRVQLRELGRFQRELVDQPVEHKNARPVVYLKAEPNGLSPNLCVLRLQRLFGEKPLPAGYSIEWDGEGEWRLTMLAIRDLGCAFAAALVLIFVILVAQLQSFTLPLLIMTSIPLTFIGIFPCHWVLNLVLGQPIYGVQNPFFFTATSLVGVIAVSGIVVRNGIILIDFIELKLVRDQLPLVDALVQAIATRTRPICLTALTAMLASLIITLDPPFSGLAWSFISGICMSTVFTLVVIPLIYGLVFWPLFGESRKARLMKEAEG
jgi:multidrug efflux pump subunit AcrB